jgi:hypothetical protein
MVTDALEDELTLDRRLPATLGALFLDPGQLTVEYVNGRIVRYIRPFRLYLVSSVIFFLLLSFTSLRFLRQTIPGDLGSGPTATAATAATDTVALAEIDRALAAVREELESPDLNPVAREVLRTTRNDLIRRRAALQAGTPAPDTRVPAPPGAEPDTPRAPPRDAGRNEFMATLDDVDMKTGVAVLDSAVNAKIRSLARMEPRQAAERLASDFLRYIPTVLFVLLPVFAGVLKVLYIRRRRFYAEHFIFLLHTHAFVFLLFTVLLLTVMLGLFRGWIFTGLSLWLLAYTYLAMRRVYGQGWLKTLVKWWVLGWIYFWILGLAVPVAFLLTALLA